MRDTTKQTPSLSQLINDAIRAKLIDLRVSMPGKVMAYDATQTKARIKPLLKKEYFDGEIVELPEIPGVPVRWDSANSNKAFIHLPLAVGDTGLLHFCDRNIDVWLSKAGDAELPGDTRIHDLSDAVFVPGIHPFGNTLNITNSANLTIKNDNLTIELDPNGKISISGSSAELLTLIKDIITNLKTTQTCIGIGNPVTSVVINPAFVTLMTALETLIGTLIP